MNKTELMEKYGKERVLCVDSRHFENIDISNNIVDEYMRLISNYGTFFYRYDAELDESKKQIIPYIVLKSGNKYMLAKRLKGDSRLVGGYTIGMGGHIDHKDLVMANGKVDSASTISICIKRELYEETTVDQEKVIKIDPIKCFIDESSDVSRVHACILYVMELEETDVQIKETDKLEAEWLAVDEITDDMYNSLEGWSKIAYGILFGERKKKRTRKAKSKSEARRLSEQIGEDVQVEQDVLDTPIEQDVQLKQGALDE